MALRILFIGVDTKNPHVDTVPFLSNAPSLFDYDIIIADVDSVFEPEWNRQIPNDEYITDWEEYNKLRKEFIKRLKESIPFMEKGGKLICFLKPQRGFVTDIFSQITKSESKFISNYDWIPIKNLRQLVTSGFGKKMNLCDDPKPFADYLRMDETYWIAYFEGIDKLNIQRRNLALNDAGKPIATEFLFGKGSIVFLPVSKHENIGDILLTCEISAFKKIKERYPPFWMKTIKVPGEDAEQKALDALSKKISTLKAEYKSKISLFEGNTQVKKLLYEKGRPLEEAVKKAFEELGFTLIQKDDKDWIASSATGEPEAILEVTGTDGTIDIGKLRQLLNYLISDFVESNVEKKAILVGNHFANDPLETRGDPFTRKVIEEAKVHSICLLPTPELFKAICYLREGKAKVDDIRKEIIGTIGIFKLA